MDLLDHLLYGALWLSFAVPHSILAVGSVKARLSRLFGRSYRLAYNIAAALHIGVVLVIGRLFLSDGMQSFAWPDAVQYALWGVQAIGAVLLFLALLQYDLGLFAGTRQLREPSAEDEAEPLNTGGLNALCRHPIYLGGHLLVWGGIMDPFTLATAIWASAYMIIGARYEEKRLAALYGEAYTAYQKRTSFLIPGLW